MNGQSARYFTSPPISVPEFFFRRYAWMWSKLIKWATKEYNDALILFSRRGAMKTVKYLNEEYSAMRVLAEMPNFRRLVSLLVQEPDVWNKLNGRERVFIRRAYEIHSKLNITS